jgi:hypothetical protein
MFDDNSRYKGLKSYERIDRRGRTVATVPVPPAPAEKFRGYHRRIQGQRLDHLAYRYLGNPAGYWRICEQNDVMLPEALSEAADIAVPLK